MYGEVFNIERGGVNIGRGLVYSGGSSYGRTWRPPPIDQNLGLVMAARLRHGGKFSPKSLTFGHFFCIKIYKKLSASVGFALLAPTTALPLDTAGGSVPKPPFRLTLYALAMVPPLANPGSPPLVVIICPYEAR